MDDGDVHSPALRGLRETPCSARRNSRNAPGSASAPCATSRRVASTGRGPAPWPAWPPRSGSTARTRCGHNRNRPARIQSPPHPRRRPRNRSREVAAAHHIGSLHQRRGEYGEAATWHRGALAIADVVNEPPLRCRTRNGLGGALTRLGRATRPDGGSPRRCASPNWPAAPTRRNGPRAPWPIRDEGRYDPAGRSSGVLRRSCSSSVRTRASPRPPRSVARAHRSSTARKPIRSR
jgi:hypothetical protein